MNDERWQGYLRRIVSEQCIRPEDHGESANPIFGENMSYLRDCRRVLDIGCGIGSSVHRLRSQGVDAHGLTLNQAEIDLCRQHHGDTAGCLTTGDMHDLPYPDGSFDGAMMWDSLEHALAPIVALWEVHRVLSSGGKLLVYIPPQLWIEHPVHTWVPTQRQAQWMFKMCGFNVESMEDRQDQAAMYRLRKI